ncbi:hypothetical protein ASO20_01235 [Mycoplasma sp. (ex Biomphalaria glabrata)]|uniref:cardiolipin synthase n=1 Tax=Mycoplasma sp. (ex Biomphalaria glabrata) TaxID=1749074 RepID=UPI00073A5DB1|nr:cardiolipin synthase [Mycoplasma sp. (ex Biomphalaria glabrata)]ALV23281.1 hypothetical protein ASO20_01235 [Mycoplasma sp. (ex Biomphalaria glabrata)]
MILITSLLLTFFITILMLLVYFIDSYINSPFYIVIIVYLLNIILSFIILSSDRRHDTKITWTIIIFAVPIFGAISYFLFGRKFAYRINQKRFLEQKSSFTKQRAKEWEQNDNLIEHKNLSTYYKRQFEYITSLTDSPFQLLKDYEILKNGNEAYLEIFQSLEKAKKQIFLSAYIISDGLVFDTLLNILEKKVKEDVKVYLIYDGIGSYSDISQINLIKLRRSGIDVCEFTLKSKFLLGTTLNYRYHRKIIIIDGQVGFFGGINFGNEYASITSKFGYWEDYFIKITGNGVYQLEKIYIYDWTSVSKIPIKSMAKLSNDEGNSGYLAFIPSGPIYKNSIIMEVLLSLINNAIGSIDISTPYLICPDEIIRALQNASMRGVKIRLITPSLPDKKIILDATRETYKILIPYGIEIYETQNLFVHSKIIIIDKDFSLLGSLNFDNRSFYQNFELTGFFYSSKVNQEISEKFETLLRSSSQITEEKLILFRLGFLRKWIIRILSPLY